MAPLTILQLVVGILAALPQLAQDVMSLVNLGQQLAGVPADQHPAVVTATIEAAKQIRSVPAAPATPKPLT